MVNLTPITYLFLGIVIIVLVLIIFTIIYILKAKKIQKRQEFFYNLNKFSKKPKNKFVAEVKTQITK